MIPDDVVEEVRARADIVGIIGEFVQLKKSGKDYKGLSPFKQERTPSFYVIPAKGFYHDFSSGESGDVFAFLMKKSGMSFIDAVKYVGQRSGVEVREVVRGQASEDPYRALYEANAFASEFFKERLWDWDGGEPARKYLKTRGIDREVAERFHLGFAPDDFGGLRTAALALGIEDEVLIEVGLLSTSDRGGDPYDRFRNRIVFPIENLGGRLVGFGGRVLPGAKGPKYLNSPETPLYHKGSILYGLSWAKNAIRREELAVVVEGYMDVVSLAIGGVQNAVATLGTAMTPEHARVLRRYTQRAVLLFDADAAGQKATFRAGDVLLAAGMHPATVTLPDGEDPDTVVQSEGGKKLRVYLDQAVDVMDRKLQLLEERGFFTSSDGTRKAVDRVLPSLRATVDPALRDIYVSKVAERTGVRRETLEAELSRSPDVVPGAPQAPERGRPPPRLPVPSRMGAERLLLLLLVKDRTWIDRAVERIGAGDLTDPAFRAIFQALVDDPDMVCAPEGMDPVAARALEALFADRQALTHAGHVFQAAVTRIERVPAERDSAELSRQIQETDSFEKGIELLKAKEELQRQQREAGEDWLSAARRRSSRDQREP